MTDRALLEARRLWMGGLLGQIRLASAGTEVIAFDVAIGGPVAALSSRPCLYALNKGDAMRRVLNIYRSTVGKKVLMAVSGALFTVFVLGHMYGNLKSFFGPEVFNHYAEFLREMGAPMFMHGQLLWLFRIALIIAVLLHVIPAIQLWLLSRSARPVNYARKLDTQETNIAARTMIWGGLLIGTFVVLHILHFTTGNLHPDFIPGDAYNNLVGGFQWPPVPILYIVVMAALCFHLYHGVWSALQTLGVNHPRYNKYRRPLALVVAAVVFVGFISVPVGVLAGMLTLS